MEEVATMPSNAQEFCLRWNNFHSSLVSALDGFKNDLDFVDVTLACEGQFLKAHKMLLSACSVFFRDLLKANPCQHPIVILPPEVRFIDLEKMLRFIYQGEVNVHQENLARFLKTAEMLKIRGLAEDNEKKVFQASSPRPQDGSERGNDNSSVSPKRPRLSIEAQSGSLTDPSQTSNDENSRLSGPDSDSEMIPVKQEMIELKECDFETADNESFLAEAYLREGSSATSSNNTSNTQPPQAHPAAPPPPGPLLPSYVPPPQVKSQDDSPLASNQEELSQGTFARLASDNPGTQGGGEGEDPGWTSGHTPRTSNPRLVFQRSAVPNKYSCRGSWGSPASAGSSPVSPHPPSQGGSPSVGSPTTSKNVWRSPAQRVSPGKGGSRAAGGVDISPGSSGAVTGSSRSIWHPPSSAPYGSEDDSIGSSDVPSVTVSPVSGGPVAASGSLTCDICFKTFTSRSNLNKHKRVQHSGEEYLCPICKRTFKNRYYIKDHVNLCAATHKKAAAVSSTPNQMPPPAPEDTPPNHDAAENTKREDQHLQQQQQPTSLVKKEGRDEPEEGGRFR